MPSDHPPIILGSSSPFRQLLLDRLGLAYSTVAPDVDETGLPGETPAERVARLAEVKARAVGALHTGLVIGSDQLATIDDEVLGKPGNHATAIAQLSRLSGRRVEFLTGLCLLDTRRHELQVDVVPFQVTFRQLTADAIERYLQAEQPYGCAGSFKSEGLGITLFEEMSGTDPTALIGLPLIRLTGMLAKAGVELP